MGRVFVTYMVSFLAPMATAASSSSDCASTGSCKALLGDTSSLLQGRVQVGQHVGTSLETSSKEPSKDKQQAISSVRKSYKPEIPAAGPTPGKGNFAFWKGECTGTAMRGAGSIDAALEKACPPWSPSWWHPGRSTQGMNGCLRDSVNLAVRYINPCNRCKPGGRCDRNGNQRQYGSCLAFNKNKWYPAYGQDGFCITAAAMEPAHHNSAYIEKILAAIPNARPDWPMAVRWAQTDSPARLMCDSFCKKCDKSTEYCPDTDSSPIASGELGDCECYCRAGSEAADFDRCTTMTAAVCESSYCMNGGTGTFTPTNGPDEGTCTCACTSSFYGRNCELQEGTPCTLNDCNHRTYDNDDNLGIRPNCKCNCGVGIFNFYGPKCEEWQWGPDANYKGTYSSTSTNFTIQRGAPMWYPMTGTVKQGVEGETCQCTDWKWCRPVWYMKAGGKYGCVGDSYIVRGPPAYTSNSNGLKCIADPNPTTKVAFNVKNPHFCSREDPDSLQKCEPSKCLEKGKVDEDCCAHENDAACADGYIYSKRGNCWREKFFNTCCTPPPAPGGSTEANNEGNDDEGNVNEAPTEAPTETPTEAPTAAPLVSGSFKLSNRAYSVSVPVGAGPFPVILLLHGNGGSGSRFLKDINDDLKVLTTTHILFAPDGPQNSWNIVAEKSKEDDALYVGTTLVNHLVEASNVKPEFTLFGHSNGAALTNRILIENDDARIVAAITDVSQLNTHQYHDGNFYIGGSDNSYTTVKSSLTKRKLLQLTGARDNVIPAAGGESPRIPAKTGKLKFLAWEESIYLFAKAYGFTGARDTATDDSTGKIQRVSYPDVHVSASNYKEAGHAVAPGDGNSEVLAFFDREAAPTEAPIEAPTEAPTEEEEEEEEKVPTEAPTETTPTESPTIAPTDAPNEPLTEEPTPAPTSAPGKADSHSCARGKLEVHDVSENHADVCRVPGQHWECPVGCEFAPGKSAPYCLWAGTKEKCHESTKPSGGATSAPTVAPTKAPTEAPTDAPAPPKMKRRCANWCLRSVRRKQKGWWKTHAGQKAPACHWYKCNGCSPECTTPPSRCVEWCNEPVGTKKRKCEANDGCADCDTIVLNGGVKDTCKTTPTATSR